MLVFLLKSSACLAIFLMFYKLLLEKECMHTFKRYYLLVALVLALVIPSITFTEYVEVIPTPASIAPEDTISTETTMAIRENTAAQEVNTTGIDYWLLVLWTLYGLGVLLFSLKFFFNLQKIARNIRNNQKLKIDSIINVLLKDAIVPHTFLNYIFLNRQKFESNEIPKDVLVHEATHARQKHSLDVLFVELLQIAFWFNPLIHLAKKSIKLNHEFLADAAVIHQGSATADYQNTLLAFASSANYKNNQPSMANAINYSSYSSIKKRFKVMKTRTSKKSILVKSIMVLPILAFLVFGFSGRETKTIVKKSSSTESNRPREQNGQSQTLKENWKPTRKDFEKWKENGGNFAIYIHGKSVKSSELVNYDPSDFYHFSMKFVPWNKRSEQFPQPYKLHLYNQEEFEKLVNTKMAEIHVLVNKNMQILVNDAMCSIDSLADRLHKLKIVLDREGKRGLMASFAIDNGTPKKFAGQVRKIMTEHVFIDKTLENNLPEMDTIYTYNRLAKRIKTIPENREPNVAYIKEIYAKMDDSQKSQVDSPAEIVNKIRPQHKATPEMIAKYNRLAKKYNALPKANRVIVSEDLQILETIYSKMTKEQKADAEPFPECPDPKSDQDGATTKQIGEYNRLAKSYNTMLANNGNFRIKKSDVDRLEYLYAIMTDDQRNEAEPFPDFPEPPEPPAPPRTPNLNDHQYAQNKIEEIIQNQDPYDNGGRNINLSVSRKGKKKQYPKKDHSMIRTVEEVKNEEEGIQKRNAVFNFNLAPKPPEPPMPARAPNEKMVNPNVEVNNQVVQEIIENQEIYDELNGNIRLPSHFQQNQPFANGGYVPTPSTPLTPPAPPTPKSPLDFIKEMTKKDARFYYQGEEIDSEKAIEIMKKNPNIDINTKRENGENPVVRLSTEA